ncbi:hypothetical protein [Pseudomonas typographi]|uniref:hypothetical protein n=1 Tax=Pseudomonas typographi TaxID=2715964 RepID=UPI001689C1E9|nr:hypothetical protein [Pseudomonas typographi]MBD1554668.1 hypothetical protein [Pseudomonas typographi]
MTTPIHKSIIDEQIDEVKAQVRGTVEYPASMRVADLKHPIKADWLKRRPVERRS